ncbi:cytochrome P450 [Actinoplanes sp. NBRC 14428]|uniref:Cytochrome P450 n=1 Tax=Pseudosporangium ferrugineum TaxID=439699 RepID=A0A2T0RXA8_9ACTN|nr:cytochrome P450 [Pseudosporangium ferrugineum]PRY25826.1 hypothetical protein CLV70_112192 [Pseudosporangium ferrugineum]BCJ56121.1 cytochrome P450 [Actinoplanes sp. NBRC 14428]
MTDSRTEFDLFSPAAMAEPMPLLHRIRAQEPVAWLPQLGAYLLTRHADVVAVLKDRRLDVANMARGMDRLTPRERAELQPLFRSLQLWMGHTDPTDHVRFQKLLKRYFTPATVEALRPRVRQITHDLLDAVAPGGRMEAVRDLAYPLPASVIAEILGLPATDRDKLQQWSRDILAVFGIADVTQFRRAQASVLAMQDHLRPLLDERRRAPREDVLSVFAEAEREGLVTEEEILANGVLLLFAGHETTAGLIGNGLALLFENPGQLELLKAKPELMRTAVEEMLRYDGPAGVLVRVAAEPVTVGGREYPAGTQFYLAMVAGNRDPEVFADPDRFDITRTPNRHTAFGLGTFYCLGAALARMETDECLRILLERFPGLRPGEGGPVWQPSLPVGHRLTALPVELA